MDATTWKIFKKVQAIASSSGAYIFGGFPRDALIHEQGAISFYNAREKAPDGASWDYGDPTCHPESFESRTLLPADMDVLMDTAKVQPFFHGLKKAMFHVRKSRNEVSKYQLGMKHIVVHVTFRVNPLMPLELIAQLPSIKLDILHKPSMHPNDLLRSKTLDFACNSLYITPDNSLQFAEWSAFSFPTNQTRLQEIVDQVHHKQAVLLCTPPPFYRIENMLKKGYTVTNHMVFSNQPVPDTCAICYGEFAPQEITARNTCCVPYYHVHCYLEYINTSTQAKCAYCRVKQDHKAIKNTLLTFPKI